MFGFGKKKSAAGQPANGKKKPAVATVDPAVVERIHVMPARFYAVPPKKRSMITVVLIVAGVLLLAALAGLAYVFFKPQTPGQPAANQNVNVSQPINQNGNTNQPATNQNQNLNTNAAGPIVPTTTPTWTNVNTNTNTNTNTSDQPLTRGPDADGDGLTTAEEALYGTDPTNQDTDLDTYADGSELLNGYDPTKPAAPLAGSGLVATYQHARYAISYPAAWQVQALAADGSETIFRDPSGELVEVILVANPQGLPLEQWYLASFGSETDGVTPVTVGALDGLRSADGRNYYFLAAADPATVYLATYNTGTMSQINFLLTFNLMLKSLTLNP